MHVGDGWTLTRASSYSACIVTAARGQPQRGVMHSVFPAAANVTFPDCFVLSLNAVTSPCMPNGLQLSALPGTFPFPVLRAGMPVLFGAQRLLIEAVDCSLDLSSCTQWNPHIERPAQLDMEIVERNRASLLEHVPRTEFQETCSNSDAAYCGSVRCMAQFLCGRGVGLTPTGDDI